MTETHEERVVGAIDGAYQDYAGATTADIVRRTGLPRREVLRTLEALRPRMADLKAITVVGRGSPTVWEFSGRGE